ncbi:TetR/AcrR family transcriptional regulator [Isoptericola hypogeus]|uniref:TetR/AcrR family transcriptional regulator n=1 Tax=Isoptericola hypogeus TaxID=300179 RepID=A0ABN2IXR8_9MICO
MVRTGQGPGRPRDSEIDEAVLGAARELLAEVGYAAVTMDAAAARAGTSKAAIYRRYRSKAELLFAAAVHSPAPAPTADTGSLAGDLAALARRVLSDMTTPAAREVAPQVVAEVARSPEAARRLRDVFVSGERAEVDAVLDRATGRGELPTRPDVATVHRVLGGALFFSVFVIGEEPDEAALADVVDLLVAGLTTRSTLPS